MLVQHLHRKIDSRNLGIVWHRFARQPAKPSLDDAGQVKVPRMHRQELAAALEGLVEPGLERDAPGPRRICDAVGARLGDRSGFAVALGDPEACDPVEPPLLPAWL